MASCIYSLSIELFSRHIIDWELSDDLSRLWILDCLKRAFKHRKLGIINSAQGAQFTNNDYVELLQSEAIKISMDGKDRALDNIFVERFLRTLKYEEVYLNEYVNLKSLRRGINQYIQFYNEQRPHESLEYRRPAGCYQQMPMKLAL